MYAHLTLEEMERRAYANGDTQTATLLARALDESQKAAEDARAEGYEEGREDGKLEGRSEALSDVRVALERLDL